MRKHFFTLLEVILALALASFLLSSLFFWYQYFGKSHKKVIHAEWVVLEERYVIQKLEFLFTQITPFKENKNGLFYTSEANKDKVDGTSLVFYFNNGTHLNPKLSDKVLGRLYLDKNGVLCLGVWSLLDHEIHQTIPIIDKVKKVDFFFFKTPSHFLGISPAEINPNKPQEGWQKKWRKEFQELPCFTKMVIERNLESPFEAKKPLELLFEVSEYPKPIIFSEKGGIQ